MTLLTYAPPKQLQDKQIWSLVIINSRQEKVSEYNWTKKKMPLLSWSGIQKRYKANPKRFAPVAGLVSKKVLIIDIDNNQIMPNNIYSLIQKYPTHYHMSKSGNGWKVYYIVDSPLSKMWVKHSSGELFSGMWCSTTNPALTDYSDQTVASITRKQISEFIPEANKELQHTKQLINNSKPTHNMLDMDTMLNEAKKMLAVVPPDINPLLEIAYETKLKDTEVNSYSHWLLVSHALSDLATQLASEYSSASEKIAGIFLDWSRHGRSFVSDEDVTDRFYRSFKETQGANKPIISFNTLRKLYWGYRIPVEDFPVIVLNKKGKYVDFTDPENYGFLTDKLKIKLCRDYSNGDVFVKGPQSIIKHYFRDQQFNFLTQETKNMSIPFHQKFKSDDNLLFRLVKLYRHFGIKSAGRGNPLFFGLHDIGVEMIDTLHKWTTIKPWDKKPRVLQIIEKSVLIDETVKPSEVPKDFYHQLILKHLIHTIGLRAKASRVITNKQKLSDRFKKAQGILIFAGYQNTRKSTWIECLLPPQAGFISNVTPSGVKDTLEMQRALAGTFILNIDEIDAVLDNINLSDFKNVITQDQDSFRTMYSQKFEAHPRAAGFFGTTNKKQLRLDRTGNRRFWIIPIKMCDASALNKCNYQQFWAELLYYAENLGNEEWNLSGQEKEYINATARYYTKQTLSGKTLDIIFADKEGENLLYTHDEIDFDILFDNIPQTLQRIFCQEGLFFPVHGNKAYVHLQNKFIMDNNVDFKLGSFGHEICDFIDNITGIRNETKQYSRILYKNGIVYYNTGKPKHTKFHFLPYKDKIDKFVDNGKLPHEIFLK